MDDAILQVTDLTKNFGTRRVLDRVSFSLPQGACLAVFGANGAGKTTMLRILATLLRPSSGAVSICGCDLSEDADAARGKIGFIAHDPMLYPELSVQENLMFYARLYGVADAQARVAELCGMVGLATRRLDPVSSLSRGMTQRAAIARALVNDPPVVLLDEPTSGLDVRAQAAFDAFVVSERARRGFVMASHDFEKGLAIADYVLVLDRGRMVLFTHKNDIDLAELRRIYERSIGMGAA